VNWELAEADSQRCFSNEELSKRAGVSKHTVIRLQQGEKTQKEKAFKILKAQGIADPYPYLSKDPLGFGQATKNGIVRRINHWELDGQPIAMRSPNSLVNYKIDRAVHEIDGRIGRVKRYDLEPCSDEQKNYIQDVVLTRHPQTCMRLAGHPNFPKYIDCGFIDSETFWVIDQWEDNVRLDKAVASQDWCNRDVPRVARQIAESLSALHQNGIIRRELTPEFIALRESDHSVMLLDFELAKIAGAPPSRPMDWSRSPYLAKEVDSPNVDVRADLFSWGQVILFCLTGRTPPKLADQGMLNRLPVPKGVFTILKCCLDENQTFRPKSFEVVLDAIKKWN
jgi:serine/threonine protein kinase